MIKTKKANATYDFQLNVIGCHEKMASCFVSCYRGYGYSHTMQTS